MSTEQIWEIGQQRLAKIEPETEGINTWKAHLTNYLPSTEYPDDAYAWLTCILALEAIKTGNFGVGCILSNDAGKVVTQGHNEVFIERCINRITLLLCLALPQRKIIDQLMSF